MMHTLLFSFNVLAAAVAAVGCYFSGGKEELIVILQRCYNRNN